MMTEVNFCTSGLDHTREKIGYLQLFIPVLDFVVTTSGYYVLSQEEVEL